ncbi:hypothetical protein [Nocardia gipuzkoensis]|uniref:hypothetical protein n=1 Tax=Nocardia gipuzkoensis TaxID=2749991 RepID=UPI00237E4DDE|nr:hypothetical protein [Nocardia gipuzkoensis]MDE1675141.1 hypothetical protein [Nocardia gipuzkoensis]
MTFVRISMRARRIAKFIAATAAIISFIVSTIAAAWLWEFRLLTVSVLSTVIFAAAAAFRFSG